MGIVLNNIMHAGGRIGGIRYTNSLESIELSIRNKEMLIELDCVKTKESYVLAHDGTEKSLYNYNGHFKDITLEQYSSLKVGGVYTPMTYDLLRTVMERHSNVTFIIDAKVENERYLAFLKYMRDNHPDVLDRLCLQVYSEKDVVAVSQFDVNRCVIALWKYFDKDPFSEESLSFIEQTSHQKIEVLGVSLRYQNPFTKQINPSHEKLEKMASLGHKIFLHGQDGILSLQDQVRLNLKFGFFSSISYNELPHDFDWRSYTSLYKDIATFDELRAKCHYLQYGIDEKRLYKLSVPNDFNWRTYAALNKDVQLTNELIAKAHFTRYGFREGRPYRVN